MGLRSDSGYSAAGWVWQFFFAWVWVGSTLNSDAGFGSFQLSGLDRVLSEPARGR